MPRQVGIACSDQQISRSAGIRSPTIGPLVMSVFLMKVSGVTLLEKKLSSTKPGYQEYVARTNAFFPGLPQRK
ncbi:DUF1295 domain-containing protein [Blastopirellula sp. J2-11]|uniref:DUF1295 domain-containing protein n=1 Tax=Blastopirellula sp. J2-11 TaxID=2943192 RepID=UPI003966E0FE